MYFLSTENTRVGYVVANLRTFRRTFYMPKKCRDVSKLTNIRYVHWDGDHDDDFDDDHDDSRSSYVTLGEVAGLLDRL